MQRISLSRTSQARLSLPNSAARRAIDPSSGILLQEDLKISFGWFPTPLRKFVIQPGAICGPGSWRHDLCGQAETLTLQSYIPLSSLGMPFNVLVCRGEWWFLSQASIKSTRNMLSNSLLPSKFNALDSGTQAFVFSESHAMNFTRQVSLISIPPS